MEEVGGAEGVLDGEGRADGEKGSVDGKGDGREEGFRGAEEAEDNTEVWAREGDAGLVRGAEAMPLA